MTTPRKQPADAVISAMMAQHWAILPNALETMLSIAERTNIEVDALEKQRGEALKNSNDITVRDGIATIEATGPMMRYGSFFSRISGATSYDVLAQDLTTALEDPRIKAIIFAINSPGGQVDGNLELSDMVFAARGVKPIVAYVSHLGASAAYRLAAATDEIIVSPESILGSIGVVLKLEKTNPNSKTIEIVSTQSPKKRLTPESPEGLAQAQSVADAIAQTFIESVAKYRGVSVDTVLAEFGGGGVFLGQAAVDAGLADRMGSYESVLAELRDRVAAAKPGVVPVRRPIGVRASTSTEIPMADQNPAGGATATPPATPAATPAPAAAAPAATPAAPATAATLVVDLAAVRAEAQTAERKRIADINALKKPGNETLIQSCIDDANCSVDMAKARLYDHERATAAGQLAGLRGDETSTAAPKSTAVPSTGATDARAAGKAAVAMHRSLTSSTRSTK